MAEGSWAGGPSSAGGGEKRGTLQSARALLSGWKAAGRKVLLLQQQQQQHARKLQTRRALERVRHAAAEEGTMQENNVGVFGGAHVVQELRVPGHCVRPSLRRGPGPAGTLLGRGRPGRPLVPAVESDAASPGSGVPELVGERVFPLRGALSRLLRLWLCNFDTV